MTIVLRRDRWSCTNVKRRVSARRGPGSTTSSPNGRIGNTVREDAQLVVSELVTNALMHGDGSLVLRASITGETVQISVTDSGDELPEVLPSTRRASVVSDLIVVDRIASEWGVSPFPGGKTVWAALTLSG